MRSLSRCVVTGSLRRSSRLYPIDVADVTVVHEVPFHASTANEVTRWPTPTSAAARPMLTIPEIIG
jgi:hypothetical protein